MPAALGDPRAAGAEWGGERERTETRQRAVRTEVTEAGSSAAGWRGGRLLPLDSPPPSAGLKWLNLGGPQRSIPGPLTLPHLLTG